jgi:hypothetical protein
MKQIIEKGSTLFLKLTLMVMGAAALALLIFALPELYEGALRGFPYAQNAILVIVFTLYVFSIAYYVVLWQAWKILVLIDKNKGFSTETLKSLSKIKWASISATLILMIGFVPFLFPIAEIDDAPGLLLYGFIFACIPLVVAVFAAILEKLFQNAMELKSENELTI